MAAGRPVETRPGAEPRAGQRRLEAEGTLLHDVASHVSVWAHMNDFASGIVDSRRLVFYASTIGLPIFATSRVVDSWRWSG